MFQDTGENAKVEAGDVRILRFGKNEHGLTITATGAVVPDSVPIYTTGMRSVGRATLRLKEDGIYADLALSIGSLGGMEASAIIRPIQTDKATQVVESYEVRAVGLNEIPKVATKSNETNPDPTPAKE